MERDELTAESLWAEVAGRLQGALNTTTYRTWFAHAGGAELTDEAFLDLACRTGSPASGSRGTSWD